MNYSRRKFFYSATPALAAGLFLSGKAIVRGQETKTKGLNTTDAGPYSWNTLYPFVGTDFYFTREDSETVKLRLTRMDDLRFMPARVKAGQSGGECFALMFRGSLRTVLTQGNYTVRHGSLGEFSLFITALGLGSQGGYIYEAAINRSNV